MPSQLILRECSLHISQTCKGQGIRSMSYCRPCGYVKHKEQEKQHYHTNKRRLNVANVKYQVRRMKLDMVFRLKRLTRRRQGNALKRFPSIRPISVSLLIGCSWYKYKEYIESKMESGMTWENHGHGEGKWEIDHIRPCISFDFNDDESQFICFHYANTQPLWWKDNIRKHGHE
jgi:hypothetical protein